MSSTNIKPAPLLIGHGSRHPKTAAAGRAFADDVSRLLDQTVDLGWLDYCDPPIGDILAARAKQGHSHLAVQPLMLTPAGHVTTDIPAALNSFPGKVTLGSPLGTPFFFRDLVTPFINTARKGFKTDPTIFLIARDSHSPVFKQAAEELGDLLKSESGLPLQLGYVGATEQKWEDMLAPLTGHSLIVVPTLLFPGQLWDKIAARFQDWSAQTALMLPFSSNPALAQRVAQRILALQEDAARDC